MTPAEKAALLARITRAQSVGATILSNMTAAKKMVEAVEAVDAVAAEPMVKFDRRVLLAPGDALVDDGTSPTG